ncbi:hypothetical protein D3C79_1104930 [compost metagenome]
MPLKDLPSNVWFRCSAWPSDGITSAPGSFRSGRVGALVNQVSVKTSSCNLTRLPTMTGSAGCRVAWTFN